MHASTSFSAGRNCSGLTGRTFSTIPIRRDSWVPPRAKGPSSSGGEPLDQIQSKLNGFVKEMKPKVAEVVEDAKRSARRTYQRLDTEYEFSEKTEKATKRLKEAAVDVDQNYGIRRRLRRVVEWFQRSWPIWSRQFEEFTSTPVGKFIVIGSAVLLMTTPIFWRVLNFVILLWWVALPVATFITVQKAQKAAEEQRAAMEAERERQRDPLGSIFRDAARGVKNAADKATRQGGGGGGRGKGGSRGSEGPIIDAEWRPLDKP